MDCEIQTWHPLIALRFLRGFCSLGCERCCGEDSDLQNCPVGIESLLCLCATLKVKWHWCLSRLWRKGTWQEGQKPKGGLWSDCVLPKQLLESNQFMEGWEGFLDLTLSFGIGEENRISLKSVSVPGALCNLDLVRTACLYFEFGTTDSPFLYTELFICQKSTSRGLFTFSLTTSKNK